MNTFENIEKNLISQLFEEDKVNELLSDFNFKKPRTVIDIYIREQFKDNEDLYKKNIYNRKKEKLFIEKYKQYTDNYRTLNEEEKSKYKNMFDSEKKIFSRNIEIIKKYVFKGIDGNIKLKKTGYQIYLSDELINGLDKGLNVKQIMNDSFLRWENLDLNIKKKYFINAEETNLFLDLFQHYKYINSFLVFVFHYLKKNVVNKSNCPTFNELVKLFNNLSSKRKNLYNDYSNQLVFLKFKLRDIYDAIHGIKPKTPSGAFRIFLQDKAINNEIKSINEGRLLWNNLNVNEKEIYLSKCHLQFLAYKYKELLFNKKIKRIFPKKIDSPFHLFIKRNKGLKIPNGISPFNYYKNLFNKLSKEKKDMYNKMFLKEQNIYKDKISDLSDKIFQLPPKPKSSFAFYISERFKQFYDQQTKLDINEQINSIFKDWFFSDLDKSKYMHLAELDKLRFEKQVNEFEIFGYYSKFYKEDYYN